MSADANGPLRLGSVGPKMLTVGVPTAVAMCNGPVSPDTTSAASRATATMSVIVVGGASDADPDDAATTSRASASSPGPHNTTGVTPHTSRTNEAISPKRCAGQRLFGHAAPGLINANGPGTRARSSSRALDVTGASGNRIASSSTP